MFFNKHCIDLFAYNNWDIIYGVIFRTILNLNGHNQKTAYNWNYKNIICTVSWNKFQKIC